VQQIDFCPYLSTDCYLRPALRSVWIDYVTGDFVQASTYSPAPGEPLPPDWTHCLPAGHSGPGRPAAVVRWNRTIIGGLPLTEVTLASAEPARLGHARLPKLPRGRLVLASALVARTSASHHFGRKTHARRKEVLSDRPGGVGFRGVQPKTFLHL